MVSLPLLQNFTLPQTISELQFWPRETTSGKLSRADEDPHISKLHHVHDGYLPARPVHFLQHFSRFQEWKQEQQCRFLAALPSTTCASRVLWLGFIPRTLGLESQATRLQSAGGSRTDPVQQSNTSPQTKPAMLLPLHPSLSSRHSLRFCSKTCLQKYNAYGQKHYKWLMEEHTN